MRVTAASDTGWPDTPEPSTHPEWETPMSIIERQTNARRNQAAALARIRERHAETNSARVPRMSPEDYLRQVQPDR